MSEMHDTYGITAEMEAEAMAECHEMERREIAQRAADAIAAAQTLHLHPYVRAQAIEEDRRLARAEAFAATPRGRRLLAARARAA